MLRAPYRSLRIRTHMKPKLIAALLLLSLAGTLPAQEGDSPDRSPSKKMLEFNAEKETDKVPRKLPGGWTLKWNDEFNGTQLDTTKWQREQGTVRNHGASHVYVDECVEVRDGLLILHSKAEDTKNPVAGKQGGVAPWDAAREVAHYASGSVTSRGRVLFSPPGRLEFRARIPKAKGVWPAIWTMHQNTYSWPANGEIDILEHISQEPNRVYSIFRWGQEGKQRGDREKKVVRSTQIPDLSKEFHTYTLEWDRKMMRILIDDKEVGKIDIADAKYPNGVNPLLTPCYIIMNTAIGGPGTWPEKPDPAQYPVQFEIDYVRFYAKAGGAANVLPQMASDGKSSAAADSDDAKSATTKGKKGAKGKSSKRKR